MIAIIIIGIIIMIWILREFFMFITGNDDIIANQKKILNRLGNKEIDYDNLFREKEEEKERIRKERREEKEKHMEECGNIEHFTVFAIIESNIIVIFLYFTNFIWLGDYLNEGLYITFLIISYIIPIIFAYKRAKKFVKEEGIVIENYKFFDYFFIEGIKLSFWAIVIMAVLVIILMRIFS